MKNSGWGALAFAAALLAAGASQAQEAVVYSFQSGSGDGQSPNGGPAIDKAGNLYGTTTTGGTHGSGVMYELSPPSQAGGDWTETILYNFGDTPAAGGSPGVTGQGGTVILDGDGNLYGTAPGGVSNVSGVLPSGVVYELSPPLSAGGEWTAQALYTFLNDSSDSLRGPNGAVVFDKIGNLYGIAYGGGANGNGGVYELSPPTQAGNEWTMTPLYSFGKMNGTDPWGPGANASLIVDGKGNLYGTTQYGGAESSGTVYELSPPAGSAGSWTFSILHAFKVDLPQDGYGPLGSLAMDARGNLFGTTGAQGLHAGGTVFELSPPKPTGGQWTENILENFTAFSKTDGYSPFANVVLDPQGNLWGATYYGGSNYNVDSANSYGVVFELLPQIGGSWNEMEPVPYVFGSDANDAYHPNMPIVIDSKGNIYSTATGGENVCNSTSTCGAVWEFTPPAPVITLNFGPAPGVYASPISVAIQSSLENARVYYTTDGTLPTTASPRYTGVIHVSKNTTIKTMAVNDTDVSKVFTGVYTISAVLPVISPAGGTHPGPVQVTITDKTAHAVIHYTTNGMAPNKNSAVYSKPISVAATETIRAIAIATGYGTSGIASAKITIETPTAKPVFAPNGGPVVSGATVKISDATHGAVIHYTTNGATPTASSAVYPAAGIKVTKAETIKAIAIAPGFLPSSVAQAAFTTK